MFSIDYWNEKAEDMIYDVDEEKYELLERKKKLHKTAKPAARAGMAEFVRMMDWYDQRAPKMEWWMKEQAARESAEQVMWRILTGILAEMSE